MEDYSKAFKSFNEKKNEGEEFDHEFVPINDNIDIDVLDSECTEVYSFIFLD